MIGLPELIEHMNTVVSSMTPEDFVAHGRPLAPDHAIIIKLDLSDLGKRFASMVGVGRVNTFYEGCHPLEVDGTFHLVSPIANILLASIRCGDGLTLDNEFLLERFSRLADAIRAGEIEYSISMRLVNIDIDDEFNLGPEATPARPTALPGVPGESRIQYDPNKYVSEGLAGRRLIHALGRLEQRTNSVLSCGTRLEFRWHRLLLSIIILIHQLTKPAHFHFSYPLDKNVVRQLAPNPLGK